MFHAALKPTDRLTADEWDSATRRESEDRVRYCILAVRQLAPGHSVAQVQAHRSAWRTDRKHRFWNTCMPYPYPTVLQHCHALALLHGTGDYRAMAGGLRPAEFREHGANGK
jgi:hypothetical protein